MSQITLEVLAEKIDGLANLFDEKFKTNSKEHFEITKRQDVANHRTNKLEEWKEAHTREIEKEISEVLKEADNRYASKTVELHFNKIIYAVVISVLMAGLGLLLK